MTINQILLLVLKHKTKVNINILNVNVPFNNAIITSVTKDFVSFLVIEYQEFTEHIYEYTFRKTTVIGVGYIKATLELKEIDDEDEDEDLKFYS